jgi:hypothetical protein
MGRMQGKRFRHIEIEGEVHDSPFVLSRLVEFRMENKRRIETGRFEHSEFRVD